MRRSRRRSALDNRQSALDSNSDDEAERLQVTRSGAVLLPLPCRIVTTDTFRREKPHFGKGPFKGTLRQVRGRGVTSLWTCEWDDGTYSTDVEHSWFAVLDAPVDEESASESDSDGAGAGAAGGGAAGEHASGEGEGEGEARDECFGAEEGGIPMLRSQAQAQATLERASLALAHGQACGECFGTDTKKGGLPMLLCGAPDCGISFHMACIGLRSVPQGDWVCSGCAAAAAAKAAAAEAAAAEAAAAADEVVCLAAAPTKVKAGNKGERRLSLAASAALLRKALGGGDVDSDGDEGVVVDAVDISLMDPCSMVRIRTPVRGIGCSHFECFDARTFSKMRLKNCPVCNAKLGKDTLYIDTLFEVMATLGKDCGAETVHVGGCGARFSFDGAPGSGGAAAVDADTMVLLDATSPAGPKRRAWTEVATILAGADGAGAEAGANTSARSAAAAAAASSLAYSRMRAECASLQDAKRVFSDRMVLRILRRMKGAFHVTIDIVASTAVGKAVGKLRKWEGDTAVKEAAASLVKEWRTCIAEAGDAGASCIWRAGGETLAELDGAQRRRQQQRMESAAAANLQPAAAESPAAAAAAVRSSAEPVFVCSEDDESDSGNERGSGNAGGSASAGAYHTGLYHPGCDARIAPETFPSTRGGLLTQWCTWTTKTTVYHRTVEQDYSYYYRTAAYTDVQLLAMDGLLQGFTQAAPPCLQRRIDRLGPTLSGVVRRAAPFSDDDEALALELQALPGIGASFLHRIILALDEELPSMFIKAELKEKFDAQAGARKAIEAEREAASARREAVYAAERQARREAAERARLEGLRRQQMENLAKLAREQAARARVLEAEAAREKRREKIRAQDEERQRIKRERSLAVRRISREAARASPRLPRGGFHCLSCQIPGAVNKWRSDRIFGCQEELVNHLAQMHEGHNSVPPGAVYAWGVTKQTLQKYIAEAVPGAPAPETGARPGAAGAAEGGGAGAGWYLEDDEIECVSEVSDAGAVGASPAVPTAPDAQPTLGSDDFDRFIDEQMAKVDEANRQQAAQRRKTELVKQRLEIEKRHEAEDLREAHDLQEHKVGGCRPAQLLEQVLTIGVKSPSSFSRLPIAKKRALALAQAERSPALPNGGFHCLSCQGESAQLQRRVFTSRDELSRHLQFRHCGANELSTKAAAEKYAKEQAESSAKATPLALMLPPDRLKCPKCVGSERTFVNFGAVNSHFRAKHPGFELKADLSVRISKRDNPLDALDVPFDGRRERALNHARHEREQQQRAKRPRTESANPAFGALAAGAIGAPAADAFGAPAAGAFGAGPAAGAFGAPAAAETRVAVGPSAFASGLETMGEHPDANVIAHLTALAAEHCGTPTAAASIAGALEDRLRAAPPPCLLPLYYLLDSLLNNAGLVYRGLFEANAAPIFGIAYGRVPAALRAKLARLIGFWRAGAFFNYLTLAAMNRSLVPTGHRQFF
jgi:hypothetical protein